MNQYLTRPADVRAVDLGHALVLLHERTGAVWTLIGTQRQTWVELAATGATTSAAAADLAKRLRTTGLLAPTEADEPRPWPAYDTRIGPTQPSWGTQEAPGPWPQHHSSLARGPRPPHSRCSRCTSCARPGAAGAASPACCASSTPPGSHNAQPAPHRPPAP